MLERTRFGNLGHVVEVQLLQRLVEFDESRRGSSRSAVDQMAADGQFRDEGVGRPQRQRRDAVAVEVASQQDLGGHAEFERHDGGTFDAVGTMLPSDEEHADDLADADRAHMLMTVVAAGREDETGTLGGASSGRVTADSSAALSSYTGAWTLT